MIIKEETLFSYYVTKGLFDDAANQRTWHVLVTRHKLVLTYANENDIYPDRRVQDEIVVKVFQALGDKTFALRKGLEARNVLRQAYEEEHKK